MGASGEMCSYIISYYRHQLHGCGFPHCRPLKKLRTKIRNKLVISKKKLCNFGRRQERCFLNRWRKRFKHFKYCSHLINETDLHISNAQITISIPFYYFAKTSNCSYYFPPPYWTVTWAKVGCECPALYRPFITTIVTECWSCNPTSQLSKLNQRDDVITW